MPLPSPLAVSPTATLGPFQRYSQEFGGDRKLTQGVRNTANSLSNSVRNASQDAAYSELVIRTAQRELLMPTNAAGDGSEHAFRPV